MKTNNWMRFFDEPNDNGGGGGMSRGMAAVSDAPVTETPAAATPTEPLVETPPAATVDPKAIAREFGDVLRTELGRSKEEEKKPLTPEEAKKLLNVWEPDDAFLAQFDNIETKKQAIIAMRDKLLLQFDTLSQHRLREMQESLEKKYSPLLERMRVMDEEQRLDRFGGAYPQLSKKGLQPVLKAVAKSLEEQGKKFESEDEMFTALASGMEAVIKETNPDFKLQPAGSSPATKKPASAIPVTTPGAGGGTAARNTGQPAKPRGLAIFD